MAAKTSERIHLNVGGTIFETNSTTLANAGPHSILGSLMPTREGVAADYFIYNNPVCFSILLNLLRSGELHLPPNFSEKLLYHEAQFYGLLDHVRAARWGPFDGDRLLLSASVPHNATAIRASPDGGCCVFRDKVVHVYDWMLAEHRSINLDYQRVCDAAFVDSSHIVVTAYGWPDRAKGGMGLFSSVSGALCHRFTVFHDGKTLNPGALSFSDYQSKIFAICKSKCNENGIGVWDHETGNLSDFYKPQGCPLTCANKLQRVRDDCFLMVASIHPKKHKCLIDILDFRGKNLVWSWNDERAKANGFSRDMRVFDAIIMEDNRSVCVVNQNEDFGFLDLRSTRGEVTWKSRKKSMSWNAMDTCYPKLMTNGGHLFSSMKDTISVFSGPEWVLTSKLCSSAEGSISDMSIGGDRLFALHEDVIDVWESPTLPNLQL